eukprot:TRINITY_DN6832_c0_g1_i1.p1 TRINITY_DN6832_c0_g1~~TRINITY_DN6832_c0_g1_i1.p1  ORF type:complete len:134 (+),score=26.10 TRINITY_DN6832_c0_g1_i1:31-402(+)
MNKKKISDKEYVHTYDGTLTFNQVECNIDFETTIKEITESVQEYPDTLKNNCLKCLVLFQRARGNMDDRNNISVRQILPVAWEKVKSADEGTQLIFFEQLQDIVTKGSCPQGRVTRLMQFVGI